MKRKITSFTAVLVVLALLMTGTFAWINFFQTATNEWEGGKPPGGTTHDDFCAPKKEVYIENWGGVPLVVRIRLDEYMEIGEGAALKGTFNNSVWSGLHNPGNKSTSLLNGAHINDKKTWKPHIPVVGDPTVCKPSNPGFHDYWKWSMGGQKYYQKAPVTAREGLAYVHQDTNTYNGTGPNIGQTLNATVVTMAQWHTLGKPIGNYWVIDTDGWAYWANMLAPDTATGLLLNKVELIKDPENSYYYAINVIAQMATKYKSGDPANGTYGNYEDFYSGLDSDRTATNDGKELLDIITGGKVDATGIKFTGGNKTIKVGETYAPGYTVTPSNSTSPITWSSSNPAAATVAGGVITGVSAPGTAIITISANGHTDTITVTVVAGTVPTEKIEINGGNKQLTVGESYSPGYTITPANSTDPVTWSTGNSPVAVVDADGKITAVAEGQAVITVSAGGKTHSITVTVVASPLPKIGTINGEGPYNTLTNDNLGMQHLNYALRCLNVQGTIMAYPDIDQNGSIKLSAIISGHDYSGLGVYAVDSKYAGYFTIGTDKDGDPALIYNYIPEKSAWDAAYPDMPEINNVELMLTKNGFQNTLIKVNLRYTGSLYVK